MAVIYRVFQLSSRLYLQKGLQNVATPCVVSVVNHNAVSARSFASLPNICRRKLSEYSLRTEQSVAGRMPRTFGVLGFTQGFMQQQVGFASAPPTFSRQRREEKDEDKWYSNKNAWKAGLIMLGGMGVMCFGTLVHNFGRALVDADGNEIPDEFSVLPGWQAVLGRTMKEVRAFQRSVVEPSRPKLLPDPVKEPYYQPPYTLVVELTGVLVHPDWTLNTGWRFKKRPAVNYFLQQVSPPLFELVIFTRETGMTAYPLIDNLDEHGCVMYRLFRDATHYKDGAHVKDLDHLNRDLSKVIVVDCDPDAVSRQPRNAIQLKKWLGNDDDRTLVDLAAFLRTIALSNVDDVRTVLDYYNQFDDPLEVYRQKQAQLQGHLSKKAAEVPKSQLASTYSLGFGKTR